MKKKAIVIVGPTASGKTALGVYVAQKVGGEVISADSMQIYKSLSISTMGMTFSAYLIYQRIMKVYAEVIHGKSVTEAALDAGFSSSAHFADVNRRVFGISVRNLSQDLTYTKIT